MANSSKPVVAAFDFDGTLTYGDSLLPFLQFVTGTSTTIKNLLLETPDVVQYLLGKLDRQGLKEALLTRFFKNKTLIEMQKYGEQYANQFLPKMLRPEGAKRIGWHINQGHRCVLISANLDIYLNPWGKKMGFQDIIASRVEFSPEEKMTGHLIGLNCRGPEKVRRLTEVVGPRTEYILYAYGDSKGDRELIDSADYPFYRTLN